MSPENHVRLVLLIRQQCAICGKELKGYSDTRTVFFRSPRYRTRARLGACKDPQPCADRARLIVREQSEIPQ